MQLLENKEPENTAAPQTPSPFSQNVTNTKPTVSTTNVLDISTTNPHSHSYES